MILAKYLEELNGWYGSVNADNDWRNIQILKKMDKNLGLTFVPEPENEGNVCMASSPEVRDEYKQSFAPIDLLDYIYAVLHSPTYREKYKESLEIDFPRMPYPKEAETFWQLVALGGELRRLHQLEANKVEEYITSYPIEGDNTITTRNGKNAWEPISPYSEKSREVGRIWISDRQYFDNIPLAAWEYFIGDYQPAQKWLKDRREGTLSFEDILHYQKIILALTETVRLIQEIDTIALKAPLER